MPTTIGLNCLTTDGTYLYGFSQPVPTEFYLNSHIIALIRSNANPTSAATVTWTLLNAIDAGNFLYLGGLYNGGLDCTIDDKGVFSVLGPDSSKWQYSANMTGPKGLQFTPGVNNRNETQGVMPGTWTQFDLMGYKHTWRIKASSTLFNFKDKSTGVNTLMHAVVNTTHYEGMYLSAMNYEKTALVEGEISFNLNPNTSDYGYQNLGYANSNLYVFSDGVISTPLPTAIHSLTTVPITSTSTYIPSSGSHPTLDVAASTFLSCDGDVSYRMASISTDLVTICWNLLDHQAHFFYYDGTSIRELGSSGDTSLFEISSMVPLGNSSSFEIFMIPNDITGISSMRLINDGTQRGNITRTTASSVMITDTFTLKPPSPTSTLRSGGDDSGSGSGSGGGGLGAGALIGILAAVLVIIGGLVVMVRKRRTKAHSASVAHIQTRPHPQECATYEVKNSAGVDGDYLITSSQGPAFSTGQSSFMQQQQQMYPAHSHQQQQRQAYPSACTQLEPQSYLTPQQQFVFSTHPRPTVAAVMDPSDTVLQQLQQQQGYSQAPHVSQLQPSVPLGQVPTLQETPSSSISPDTLNRPLPPIPPRP